MRPFAPPEYVEEQHEDFGDSMGLLSVAARAYLS